MHLLIKYSLLFNYYKSFISEDMLLNYKNETIFKWSLNLVILRKEKNAVMLVVKK